MTIREPPREFPFRRGSGCEICGAEGPLRRVVLKESSGSAVAGNYKAPRVAYICGAHGTALATVLRPPHSTRAAGTTRLEPQKERLW